MRRVNLVAGDVLFQKGDPADDAYLILDGVIEIFADDLIATLDNDEIFGESGLVGNPRMASATARTDCRLIAFSVEELRRSIRNEPETAEKLIEVMIRRLGDTVDELARLRAARSGSSAPR